MDAIYGSRRKSRHPRKPRKRAFNATINILKDKLGSYVLIKGKKFRLGKNTTKAQLARFATNKLIQPYLLPSTSSSSEDLKHQQAREIKEEAQRETARNTQIKLQQHENRVRASDILEGQLKGRTVSILKALATDLHHSNPAIPRIRSNPLKQDLINYIIENVPVGYTIEDLPQQTPPRPQRVKQTPIIPTQTSPSISYIPNQSESTPSNSYITKPPEVIARSSESSDPLAIRPDLLTFKPTSNFDLHALSTPDLLILAKRAYPNKDLSKSDRTDLYEDLVSHFNLETPKEGQGRASDKGISNFDIDKLMKPFPEYLGTFSSDEIISDVLPLVKPQSRGGFIINTEPHNKPGQHWQAIFYDARPNQGSNSIEFFDSFGDPPTERVRNALSELASRLNARLYLKFKTSQVQHQSDKTSNCGWFAQRFLMDRFRGKSFAESSGFDNLVLRSEHDIEHFKKQHGGSFGYLPSFQQGGLSWPAIRDDFPPSVRHYIRPELPTAIKSMVICRKPIASGVNTLLNVVSLGTWQKALHTVGINKALHLYMVLNGNVRLERNHVIEMYPGGIESGSETMNVNLQGGRHLTFESMLVRTRNAVGPSLQVYDARSNNCQVFLTQILRANGLLTPELNTFINQDVKGIFEHLPSFVGKLAKEVTDIAHKADVVIHGKSKFKAAGSDPNPKFIIREVPADRLTRGEGDKTPSHIQTILFSKDLWTRSKAEKWLQSRRLIHASFDDKPNFLRFRQFDPIPGGKYRTIKRNLPEGVEFVLEY